MLGDPETPAPFSLQMPVRSAGRGPKLPASRHSLPDLFEGLNLGSQKQAAFMAQHTPDLPHSAAPNVGFTAVCIVSG